ncbi:MAG: DUF2793 domain-containing protein [Alphaproteobacteria bacterium]|uniref:DUF2793 domain-containing protein n=1 Tax=Pyruvatibacter sp. HU-CL02332 TaxID=3127650 RepID=UPI00296A2BA6|nr:DUF2793 domain-containing protein [Alphaproteobacteria bacterium]
MSETTNLSLPMLVAAQAQKHVTVNETIQALDVLVQPSVVSRTENTPPVSPADGARYIIGEAAIDAWAGHDGKLAVWQDGAWRFHSPKQGWRAFVEAEEQSFTFASGRWRPGIAMAPSGAATIAEVLPEHHVIPAAAFSDTSIAIPERSILLGVTCLVTQEVTGPTSFSVGVDGDLQRFGNGIGTGINSQLNAALTPTAYPTDTPIRITATGGDFTGGVIQIAAHILKLQIPDFV